MSPDGFDAHEVHEVAILVIPSSLDSSSSTGTGSPTLQIPESSLHDTRSSLGSSYEPPTVKFAPLPHVDPDRKRFLAPLGVPGRLRRLPVIQQEGGSLLWTEDDDLPEESMEDPIISLAKFLKKTSKTLWRKVRKGKKAAAQENVACPTERVLDIKSTVCSGDTAGLGEKDTHASEAVGSEDINKRGHRVSWSPLAERRTLGQCHAQRKSTSDLPRLLVSTIP